MPSWREKLVLATSERNRARAEFVAAAGWGNAGERLLAGDASFRKYYRLTRPRQSAVVMDAPPPQEDVRPFVRVARHLIGLGLSAPQILAEDAERGFLLLEDFGDDTYARVLAAGGDEGELYRRATDVLVELYRADNRSILPVLGAYAGDALIEAASLLPEWYLPAVTGRPTPAKSSCANSPVTRPRSISPASSSLTFCETPRVGCSRRLRPASTAFMASRRALP